MTAPARRGWLLALLALHALGGQVAASAMVPPADCPMHGDGGHHHDQAAAEPECDCERGDCHTAFKDRHASPAVVSESGARAQRGVDSHVQFATGCPASIHVAIYRSRDPPVLRFS